MNVRLLYISVFIFCASISTNAQKEGSLYQVFDDLIKAIGQPTLLKPKLEIVNTNQSIASLKDGVLRLEENAYYILQSFGPDSSAAFAYLLGHELAHYYRDHGWARKTGTAFADKDFGKILLANGLTAEQRIAEETEADMFAGFYSQMAGYNSLTIATDVIKKLYIFYRLPNEIPGYPSKESRLQIIETCREKIEQLYTVYTFGILNLAAYKFPIASTCFDVIIGEQFTSREMYNNRGLSNALEAYALFSRDEINFYLPFALTTDTHLQTQRDFPFNNKTRREELLSKAIGDFELSIRLDSDFSDPIFNLVSSYYLLGISTANSLYIDKARILINELKSN